MSKSLLTLTPVETVACCSPLVQEPIAADQAERIAPLLKAGYTHHQIGLTLFRSKRTIDGDVQKLYQKVGVTNRLELIGALWG